MGQTNAQLPAPCLRSHSMCLPSISERLTVGTKYKLNPGCNSPLSGMLGSNLYVAMSSQQSDTESKYLPLVCLHGWLRFMSSEKEETSCVSLMFSFVGLFLYGHIMFPSNQGLLYQRSYNLSHQGTAQRHKVNRGAKDKFFLWFYFLFWLSACKTQSMKLF